MKALIINTKKATFTNKESGEVIGYTNTTIGRMSEASENFSGWLIEEMTGKVADYDILKKYVNKIVELDVDFRKVDKKNYRAKILKVDEIEL